MKTLTQWPTPTGERAQHEALKLAEHIEANGFPSVGDLIRRQHALIVQMVEHADPDSSECESCVGNRWYWKECQVAERITDVQTIKTDCEACNGVGYIGPDAQFKRALTAANDYLGGYFQNGNNPRREE